MLRNDHHCGWYGTSEFIQKVLILELGFFELGLEVIGKLNSFLIVDGCGLRIC
jgi:hypothetical protein